MMKLRVLVLIAGCSLTISALGWAGVEPPVLFEPRAAQVIAPRLEAKLTSLKGNEALPVWVYFTDKGIRTQEEFNRAAVKRKAQFTEHALWRRAKVGRADMDFADLPVSQDYIQRIEALGAKLRQPLNWFNVASFEMTGAQVIQVEALPFVRQMDLLRAYRKPLEPETPLIIEGGTPPPPNETHSLNYGPSYWQIHQIRVDSCHDSLYNGTGVVVAMFDDGFRKNHAAFDSIRNSGRLIDEWDFYENADTVDWESHGTGTWSEAGGFYPGKIAGPGYGATWAIYRTEVAQFERHIEEDYWAAALQRADSVGVEVVSSSLGYFDFDPPETSYTYQDMNGNTAICSRAAHHAATLGIIVCNAMGNYGGGVGSITAPADADSILSIGAVDTNGTIANFSSRGPTYDGRTKPEVCAKGVSDYWASWSSRTAFIGGVSGTSCSTPLVAGSCAIVLQVHPNWTPIQVRLALMMTASQHNNPDNDYGWGIIDVWAAIHSNPSGIEEKEPAGTRGSFVLASRPNPTSGAATISFYLPRSGEFSLAVYDASGRLVRNLLIGARPPGHYELGWDGKDESGHRIGSGIYFYKLTTQDRAQVGKLVILR